MAIFCNHNDLLAEMEAYKDSVDSYNKLTQERFKELNLLEANIRLYGEEIKQLRQTVNDMRQMIDKALLTAQESSLSAYEVTDIIRDIQNKIDKKEQSKEKIRKCQRDRYLKNKKTKGLK